MRKSRMKARADVMFSCMLALFLATGNVSEAPWKRKHRVAFVKLQPVRHTLLWVLATDPCSLLDVTDKNSGKRA